MSKLVGKKKVEIYYLKWDVRLNVHKKRLSALFVMDPGPQAFVFGK